MEFFRYLDKSYPDMGYIFHSHTWSALSRKRRNLLPQENANLSNIFTSISLMCWMGPPVLKFFLICRKVMFSVVSVCLISQCIGPNHKGTLLPPAHSPAAQRHLTLDPLLNRDPLPAPDMFLVCSIRLSSLFLVCLYREEAFTHIEI